MISTTDSYATTSRTLWDIDVTVIPNAVDIKRFNIHTDGKIIRDKYSCENEPLAFLLGDLFLTKVLEF